MTCPHKAPISAPNDRVGRNTPPVTPAVLDTTITIARIRNMTVHIFGDDSGGSVGAVSGTEGIVAIDIAVGSQLFCEFLLLFFKSHPPETRIYDGAEALFWQNSAEKSGCFSGLPQSSDLP